MSGGVSVITTSKVSVVGSDNCVFLSLFDVLPEKELKTKLIFIKFLKRIRSNVKFTGWWNFKLEKTININRKFRPFFENGHSLMLYLKVPI